MTTNEFVLRDFEKLLGDLEKMNKLRNGINHQLVHRLTLRADAQRIMDPAADAPNELTEQIANAREIMKDLITAFQAARDKIDSGVIGENPENSQ